MTLQEKIDKLPLSIEHDGVVNELELLVTAEYVQVLYSGADYSKSKQFPRFTLLFCERLELDGKKSVFESMEIVIDRALTIIENRECRYQPHRQSCRRTGQRKANYRFKSF